MVSAVSFSRGETALFYSRIAGTGSYLPENVVTNQDLEKFVETSDEWIRSRTGIRERRKAADGETTGDLAFHAATRAMEAAGVEASELDLIVLGTTTPDIIFPSTACLLQHRLGANGCAAFDVNAACSGFVYALGVANAFIASGQARKALVVGSETLTRMLDWNDRSTCVLFGDGAGAVVLEATAEARGLLSTVLGADGAGYKHLYIPGWGAFVPESAELFPEYRPYLHMNGNEVFRFAVRVMGDAAAEAVEKANLTFDDIDLLIPHQANLRIIDAAARRLNLPREKVLVNLDRYGNTSAASIPIAICEAAEAGKLHEGANVATVAFGGGLAWAAGVVRWGVAGVCREGLPQRQPEPALAGATTHD